MRLELLVILGVVGVAAATFSTAPVVKPSPVYSGPVGHPRWGDNPCRAVLKNGELNLVFQNGTSEDYHLYTGRGFGHFEVLKSPGPIVVAASYHGCAMDVVHDCYHYDVFNVPAGQTRTMHLGKAPAFLHSYPADGPAIYRTYAPSPQSEPRRIRQR